jgi:hypothetical protein
MRGDQIMIHPTLIRRRRARASYRFHGWRTVIINYLHVMVVAPSEIVKDDDRYTSEHEHLTLALFSPCENRCSSSHLDEKREARQFHLTFFTVGIVPPKIIVSFAIWWLSYTFVVLVVPKYS